MRFHDGHNDTSYPLRKRASSVCTRSELILLIILVFAVCVRGLSFTGIGEMPDPLSHIEDAYKIAQGKFEVPDFYQRMRLGLILPISLFYWLWEVNEFSSALYPFLCSLGSVVLIFYLGQLLFDDAGSSLVCALFLAVFPMDVFYASQPMTEVPLSFLMALCVYFFLKGEQTTDKRHRKWYYIVSGIVAGFACMTKIFAVFLALFFVCYILYKKKLSTAYLWMTLGLCCVLFLESAFYYMQTGNPVHRIASIVFEPGSGVEPNPGRIYLSFLFLYPYYWFVSLGHFGFFYYFIIPAFLYSLWNKVRETHIPMLWAGSLFLYLQFGLEGKYLIHKEARFLSIITIPCLLVLGYVLTRKIFQGRRTLTFWITIGFLCLTSLVFISFQRTLQRSEVENLRAIAGYVQQLPNDTTIYLDNQSVLFVRYFLGYRMSERIRPFNRYNAKTGENSYPADLNQLHRAFVVVNWRMINCTLSKRIKFPEIIYNPPSHWEMVHTIQPSDNWVFASIRVLRDLPFIQYFPRRVAWKMLRTINWILERQKQKTIIYRIKRE